MSAELSDRLRAALGHRWVSVSSTDRRAYARDLWPRGLLQAAAGDPAPYLPDIVCWPADARQVAIALDIARDLGTPIVPYGAGSGVCGGTWPVHGGLIVDCKRLRQMSYDPALRWVTAGAGWVGQHLEDALERRGRTLGHFPSSIACSTLGGWVAARSAGQLSSRYGKIEDMIRQLRIARPDGTAETLRVDAPGADWAQVITGSEGTLAIITEATLVTHPQPETRDLAGWRVRDVAAGVDAMRRLMQAGLRPAALRLYDEFDTVLALRGHDESGSGAPAGGLGTDGRRWALRVALERTRWLNRATAILPGGCLLITGFEGDRRLVAAEAAEGEYILRSAGAQPLGPEPGLRWFSRRHSVSYKQPPTFSAGAWVDTMEVATAWSAVPALYDAVRRAAGEHVFVMAHFSHAYPEGCSIYFSFAGGPVGTEVQARKAALERYDAAWSAALHAVTDHRATISHHHGVGLSKAHRMLDEQGPGGRGLFELAKARFDPQGRMNPGKLWTSPAGAVRRALPPAPDLRPEDLLLSCLPSEQVAQVERRANLQGATVGPLPAVETMGEAMRSRTPASPRYGRPIDRVVSLCARLPDGSEFHPTVAPRKAVGPDYVRLVMTADPPLARIDSLTVRLMPLPEVCLDLALDVGEAGRMAALDAGIRPAIEALEGDVWHIVLHGRRRIVQAEAAWLGGLVGEGGPLERGPLERRPLERRLAGAGPAPEDPAHDRADGSDDDEGRKDGVQPVVGL